MKQDELVSIVVPIYNSQKYLKDVVERIVNQTYQNLEIILVNDGSTDNSGDICESYQKKDSRIVVIKKENGGLSSARNAGTKVAKGKYIAYIDSDDLVSKYYIEFLINNLKRNDADLSICGVRTFKDGTMPVFDAIDNKNVFKLNNRDALIDWLYMKNIWTGVLGKLLKKELAIKYMFPEGKYYEDIMPVYTWIKESKKIVFGNSVLFAYRISSNQQSAKSFSIREMDCIDFYQELQRAVAVDFQDDSDLIKKPLANRVISANMHIFLKIPLEGFEKERQLIWSNICCCRKICFWDIQSRLKVKVAIVLSFLGKNNFLRIGQLITK